MVSNLMDEAGFAKTDSPQPGDVGIIVTDQGLSFGIKTRLGWAAKNENGITCAPFEHLQAWSI